MDFNYFDSLDDKAKASYEEGKKNGLERAKATATENGFRDGVKVFFYSQDRSRTRLSYWILGHY